MAGVNTRCICNFHVWSTQILNSSEPRYFINIAVWDGKGKVIPLQAQCGPKGG